MTLGEKIKTTREEKKLSQGDLGKLTKIHPQHISRYENDKAMPAADKLKMIASVLEVSTDYLLFDGQKREKFEISDPMLKEQFLLISEMKKKDRETIRDLIDAYIARNELGNILKKRQTKK